MLIKKLFRGSPDLNLKHTALSFYESIIYIDGNSVKCSEYVYYGRKYNILLTNKLKQEAH